MSSIELYIRFYKTIFLLGIGLLCSFQSFGQEVFKTTYGLESPLNTTSVYDIYSASDNRLYIATANGFWSFDGITFHKYKQSLNYSLELHNIQENTKGELFVMDFSGNRFQLVQDSLLLKPSLIEDDIKNFFIKEVYTYYVSAKSIYAENNQTQEITKIAIPSDINTIQYITEDLTFMGMGENTNNSTLFRIEGIRAKAIAPTKHRALFYTTYQNEWCDREADSPYIADSNGNPIVYLTEEAEQLDPYKIVNIHNQVLVICQGGLYEPATQRIFLKGDLVTEVITDIENNIWVATTNSGLHKIPNLNYLYYPTKGTFSTDLVFADTQHLICSDRTGKLYQWDDTKSDFTLFYENEIKGMLKNIDFDYTTNQYCFSGNQIVFFDQALNFKNRIGGYGELGITAGGAVYVNQKSKLYLARLEGYYARSKILYDRASILYNEILHEDEVYTFREQPFLQKKRIEIQTNQGVKGLMYVDQKVVFNRGDTLIGVNEETYKIEYKKVVKDLWRTWGINDVIFAVTKQNIELFNAQFERIGVISREDGLEKRIISIQMDSEHIAIATREAIHIHSTVDYAPKYQFTTENGIISLDYDFHWLYNGELYVNGGKGVSKIILDSTYSKGEVALHLESVLTNGKPNASKVLGYDENNIEINFKVNSYTYLGRMKWRLNGKQWNVNTVGDQQIQLNELQAGNYNIEAVFENDMGVESTPIYYQFNIKKPYWETWWFYLLIGLSILVVLGGIVFQIIQTKRKEEQLINRNSILRMQALQAQMNPHFIFNIQAAIQGLWMRGNEEAALSLQNNFSKLLRKIFQYSGQMSISIEQLLDFLENYIGLEQVRMVNSVHIDLDVDPVLLEEEYFIPPLLVQPILENSFKHGLLHRTKDRKLKIYLKKDSLYLYCLIEDNGVGRKYQKEQRESSYKSSGLKTTRNRLGLLQETVIGTEHPHGNIKMTDLKDKDNHPTGTRVELWIPFVIAQDINDENN